MQGLKVLCPSCRRTKFETTDQYNPDIRAHGGMVKWLGSFQIDWLTSSSTLASEMCCPDCEAQLAPSGRLTVILMPADVQEEVAFPPSIGINQAMDEAEVTQDQAPAPKFACDLCGGRAFKNQMALSAHNRHKHGGGH